MCVLKQASGRFRWPAENRRRDCVGNRLSFTGPERVVVDVVDDQQDVQGHHVAVVADIVVTPW